MGSFLSAQRADEAFQATYADVFYLLVDQPPAYPHRSAVAPKDLSEVLGCAVGCFASDAGSCAEFGKRAAPLLSEPNQGEQSTTHARGSIAHTWEEVVVALGETCGVDPALCRCIAAIPWAEQTRSDLLLPMHPFPLHSLAADVPLSNAPAPDSPGTAHNGPSQRWMFRSIDAECNTEAFRRRVLHSCIHASDSNGLTPKLARFGSNFAALQSYLEKVHGTLMLSSAAKEKPLGPPVSRQMVDGDGGAESLPHDLALPLLSFVQSSQCFLRQPNSSLADLLQTSLQALVSRVLDHRSPQVSLHSAMKVFVEVAKGWLGLLQHRLLFPVSPTSSAEAATTGELCSIVENACFAWLQRLALESPHRELKVAFLRLLSNLSTYERQAAVSGSPSLVHPSPAPTVLPAPQEQVQARFDEFAQLVIRPSQLNSFSFVLQRIGSQKNLPSLQENDSAQKGAKGAQCSDCTLPFKHLIDALLGLTKPDETAASALVNGMVDSAPNLGSAETCAREAAFCLFKNGKVVNSYAIESIVSYARATFERALNIVVVHDTSLEAQCIVSAVFLGIFCRNECAPSDALLLLWTRVSDMQFLDSVASTLHSLVVMTRTAGDSLHKDALASILKCRGKILQAPGLSERCKQILSAMLAKKQAEQAGITQDAKVATSYAGFETCCAAVPSSTYIQACGSSANVESMTFAVWWRSEANLHVRYLCPSEVCLADPANSNNKLLGLVPLSQELILPLPSATTNIFFASRCLVCVGAASDDLKCQGGELTARIISTVDGGIEVPSEPLSLGNVKLVSGCTNGHQILLTVEDFDCNCVLKIIDASTKRLSLSKSVALAHVPTSRCRNAVLDWTQLQDSQKSNQFCVSHELHREQWTPTNFSVEFLLFVPHEALSSVRASAKPFLAVRFYDKEAAVVKFSLERDSRSRVALAVESDLFGAERSSMKACLGDRAAAWVHVLVTCRNGSWRLCLDGKPVEMKELCMTRKECSFLRCDGTVVWSGGVVAAVTPPPQSERRYTLSLGCPSMCVFLRDVRLWGCVLSTNVAKAVAADPTTCLHTSKDQLLGWWRCDEGWGYHIFDRSPYADHLTLELPCDTVGKCWTCAPCSSNLAEFRNPVHISLNALVSSTQATSASVTHSLCSADEVVYFFIGKGRVHWHCFSLESGNLVACGVEACNDLDDGPLPPLLVVAGSEHVVVPTASALRLIRLSLPPKLVFPRLPSYTDLPHSLVDAGVISLAQTMWNDNAISLTCTMLLHIYHTLMHSYIAYLAKPDDVVNAQVLAATVRSLRIHSEEITESPFHLSQLGFVDEDDNEDAPLSERLPPAMQYRPINFVRESVDALDSLQFQRAADSIRPSVLFDVMCRIIEVAGKKVHEADAMPEDMRTLHELIAMEATQFVQNSVTLFFPSTTSKSHLLCRILVSHVDSADHEPKEAGSTTHFLSEDQEILVGRLLLNYFTGPTGASRHFSCCMQKVLKDVVKSLPSSSPKKASTNKLTEEGERSIVDLLFGIVSGGGLATCKQTIQREFLEDALVALHCSLFWFVMASKDHATVIGYAHTLLTALTKVAEQPQDDKMSMEVLCTIGSLLPYCLCVVPLVNEALLSLLHQIRAAVLVLQKRMGTTVPSVKATDENKMEHVGTFCVVGHLKRVSRVHETMFHVPFRCVQLTARLVESVDVPLDVLVHVSCADVVLTRTISQFGVPAVVDTSGVACPVISVHAEWPGDSVPSKLCRLRIELFAEPKHPKLQENAPLCPLHAALVYSFSRCYAPPASQSAKVTQWLDDTFLFSAGIPGTPFDSPLVGVVDGAATQLECFRHLWQKVSARATGHHVPPFEVLAAATPTGALFRATLVALIHHMGEGDDYASILASAPQSRDALIAALPSVESTLAHFAMAWRSIAERCQQSTENAAVLVEGCLQRARLLVKSVAPAIFGIQITQLPSTSSFERAQSTATADVPRRSSTTTEAAVRMAAFARGFQASQRVSTEHLAAMGRPGSAESLPSPHAATLDETDAEKLSSTVAAAVREFILDDGVAASSIESAIKERAELAGRRASGFKALSTVVRNLSTEDPTSAAEFLMSAATLLSRSDCLADVAGCGATMEETLRHSFSALSVDIVDALAKLARNQPHASHVAQLLVLAPSIEYTRAATKACKIIAEASVSSCDRSLAMAESTFMTARYGTAPQDGRCVNSTIRVHNASLNESTNVALFSDRSGCYVCGKPFSLEKWTTRNHHAPQYVLTAPAEEGDEDDASSNESESDVCLQAWTRNAFYFEITVLAVNEAVHDSSQSNNATQRQRGASHPPEPANAESNSDDTSAAAEGEGESEDHSSEQPCCFVGFLTDPDEDFDGFPESDTFLYCSSQGTFHHNQGSRNGRVFGPCWSVGDTVGCGYLAVNNKIFFTKNGVFLGFPCDLDSSIRQLSPMVGCVNYAASVRVNFGAEVPHAFDLHSFVATASGKDTPLCMAPPQPPLLHTALRAVESLLVRSIHACCDWKECFLATPNAAQQHRGLITECRVLVTQQRRNAKVDSLVQLIIECISAMEALANGHWEQRKSLLTYSYLLDTLTLIVVESEAPPPAAYRPGEDHAAANAFKEKQQHVKRTYEFGKELCASHPTLVRSLARVVVTLLDELHDYSPQNAWGQTPPVSPTVCATHATYRTALRFLRVLRSLVPLADNSRELTDVLERMWGYAGNCSPFRCHSIIFYELVDLFGHMLTNGRDHWVRWIISKMTSALIPPKSLAPSSACKSPTAAVESEERVWESIKPFEHLDVMDTEPNTHQDEVALALLGGMSNTLRDGTKAMFYPRRYSEGVPTDIFHVDNDAAEAELEGIPLSVMASSSLPCDFDFLSCGHTNELQPVVTAFFKYCEVVFNCSKEYCDAYRQADCVSVRHAVVAVENLRKSKSKNESKKKPNKRKQEESDDEEQEENEEDEEDEATNQEMLPTCDDSPFAVASRHKLKVVQSSLRIVYLLSRCCRVLFRMADSPPWQRMVHESGLLRAMSEYEWMEAWPSVEVAQYEEDFSQMIDELLLRTIGVTARGRCAQAVDLTPQWGSAAVAFTVQGYPESLKFHCRKPPNSIECAVCHTKNDGSIQRAAVSDDDKVMLCKCCFSGVPFVSLEFARQFVPKIVTELEVCVQCRARVSGQQYVMEGAWGAKHVLCTQCATATVSWYSLDEVRALPTALDPHYVAHVRELVARASQSKYIAAGESIVSYLNGIIAATQAGEGAPEDGENDDIPPIEWHDEDEDESLTALSLFRTLHAHHSSDTSDSSAEHEEHEEGEEDDDEHHNHAEHDNSDHESSSQGSSIRGFYFDRKVCATEERNVSSYYSLLRHVHQHCLQLSFYYCRMAVLALVGGLPVSANLQEHPVCSQASLARALSSIALNCVEVHHKQVGRLGVYPELPYVAKALVAALDVHGLSSTFEYLQFEVRQRLLHEDTRIVHLPQCPEAQLQGPVAVFAGRFLNSEVCTNWHVSMSEDLTPHAVGLLSDFSGCDPSNVEQSFRVASSGVVSLQKGESHSSSSFTVLFDLHKAQRPLVACLAVFDESQTAERCAHNIPVIVELMRHMMSTARGIGALSTRAILGLLIRAVSTRQGQYRIALLDVIHLLIALDSFLPSERPPASMFDQLREHVDEQLKSSEASGGAPATMMNLFAQRGVKLFSALLSAYAHWGEEYKKDADTLITGTRVLVKRPRKGKKSTNEPSTKEEPYCKWLSRKVVQMRAFEIMWQSLASGVRELPTFLQPSAMVGRMEGRKGPEIPSLVSRMVCTYTNVPEGIQLSSALERATAHGNVSVSAGKWYFEAFFAGDITPDDRVGWCGEDDLDCDPSAVAGSTPNSFVYSLLGMRYSNGRGVRYANDHSPGPGDVIGCLLDLDHMTISFSINGSEVSVAFDQHAIGARRPMCPIITTTSTATVNFGSTEHMFRPEGYSSLEAHLSLSSEALAQYLKQVPATEWAQRSDLRETASHAVKQCTVLAAGGQLADRNDAFSLADAAAVFTPPCESPTVLHRMAVWSELSRLLNADAKASMREVDVTEPQWTSLELAPYPTLQRLHNELASASPEAVASGFSLHYRMLHTLATLMVTVLPALDLSDNSTHLTLYFLRAKALLIHTSRRTSLLNGIFAATSSDLGGNQLSVDVSRARARKGRADPQFALRDSLLVQLYRELGSGIPRSRMGCAFQRNEAWFTVQFIGEGSSDYGGPFRELITEIAKELQSVEIPLFIPTPNNRGNIGVDRELWMPNPGLRDVSAHTLYSFVGMIMGGCLRSDEFLPLALPQLFWKTLAREKPTLADLAQVDSAFVTTTRQLCDIEAVGVDRDTFEDEFSSTFIVVRADGKEVELIPGGATIPVTYTNRAEYAAKAVYERMHESWVQTMWIREGLLRVVPEHVLSMMTASTIERDVAGIPDVSAAQLKAIAVYDSGLTANSHEVVLFWAAVESMTNADRQALLRFVTGRSRLPVAQLVLQPMEVGGIADALLPVAHTCFFQLALPGYSSESVMKQKLLYAIHNCHAIDADFNPHSFDEQD